MTSSVTLRRGICAALAGVLVLLAGCGGDDQRGQASKAAKKASAEQTAAGSFVGKVLKTKAFVAVVAEPVQGKQNQLGVQVYVSDGRGLSEWFSGSTSDNRFVAKSDTGYAQAKGTLGPRVRPRHGPAGRRQDGPLRGKPAGRSRGPLRPEPLARREAQRRVRGRSRRDGRDDAAQAGHRAAEARGREAREARRDTGLRESSRASQSRPGAPDRPARRTAEGRGKEPPGGWPRLGLLRLLTECVVIDVFTSG